MNVENKKLVIVTTHPIQYYAPVFKLLSDTPGVDLTVLYTWGESSVKKFDPGFGKIISWDTPLLEGYKWKFLNNLAKTPGSHHFSGIINPDIIDEIKTINPDALLVYGWSYNSHLKIIRYFKGRIPVWFRGDSTLLDPQTLLKKAIRGIFLRWIYSHVDKVFYPGLASKQYFLMYGLKNSQLYFAPHAIDNMHFGKDRIDEAKSLRAKLQIKDTDILILFTGKFEEKKSPLALINAFIELSLHNTHLLMVGDGFLRETIESMTATDTSVHIHSFVNQLDIPVYYQACDLFCLSSQGPGETWGLAVNEAMAAGKAVLVSNRAGCTRDLVQEHENGLIFNSGVSGSLKSKLAELINEKKELARMGQKSKQIIQKYTFAKQVDAITGELFKISQKKHSV